LRAVPGLNQWEHQAEREKQPPGGEKNARLLKPERAAKKAGGEDQQSCLDAPESQI
jgi:hypothetical protein